VIQVDDVDSVALHEDVVAHFGIPTAGKVAKVGASFQQVFDRRAMRRLCFFFAHYICNGFRPLRPSIAHRNRHSIERHWSPWLASKRMSDKTKPDTVPGFVMEKSIVSRTGNVYVL